MNKKIHILGGGPAGMALAYYANKHNVHFSLFEKNNTIGGNCRTIKHDDFLFDTGAHRFHDKDPEITTEIKSLMGDKLLQVSSPSKIYYNRKMLNFPISVFDAMSKIDLKTNLKIIKENIILQFKRKLEKKNFQDAFQRTTQERRLFDSRGVSRRWAVPPAEGRGGFAHLDLLLLGVVDAREHPRSRDRAQHAVKVLAEVEADLDEDPPPPSPPVAAPPTCRAVIIYFSAQQTGTIVVHLAFFRSIQGATSGLMLGLW